MPKKTRREKILAQQRKRAHIVPQFSEKVIEKTSPIIPIAPTQTITLREEDVFLKTHFMLDLKKSSILIAIVITLEIVIYFGTMNNYLVQIFKF